MSTTAAWFIADANVLIDYTMTAPEVLGLVVAHIGEVYVATAVLDEVDDLDESRCVALGLTPIDGTLAQLTEASRRGGPLSFQDKLCLVATFASKANERSRKWLSMD